ncbi:thiazole synthase [Paenibacillus sambharensis]|uniref:Thiazole synthase n=1 Tax=Paenibacillus sambharensis TaxID=1803190 RepID=A0A2W1LMI6_9BACL|nr:thiazole synthase [Paenibacillus sambharensis]PZD96192.1 thiazole synthase [Paenibacillus sambharensis]
MEDVWKVGNRTLRSRLLLGTGKFRRDSLIPEVLQACSAEVVTAAVRRLDVMGGSQDVTAWIPEPIILMPNTSGARNAEEAVRIARLGQAAGMGSWVKIEVISDSKYLLPDNYETLKATEQLAREGFTVLPYMNPDLHAARQLRDAGAAAVMPLGSPIGSNRGIRLKELIGIIIEEIIDIPVIVDAGIGKPSEAAEAMELGAAAVLVNTAIATAGDPVRMAEAFAKAVEGGRLGHLAGTALSSRLASASSPLTGFLREEEGSHELL